MSSDLEISLRDLFMAAIDAAFAIEDSGRKRRALQVLISAALAAASESLHIQESQPDEEG